MQKTNTFIEFISEYKGCKVALSCGMFCYYGVLHDVCERHVILKEAHVGKYDGFVHRDDYSNMDCGPSMHSEDLMIVKLDLIWYGVFYRI